jgi:hypothetical protein
MTTEVNLFRWAKIMTLWKMRTIFGKPIGTCAEYYSPTAHLAVVEIIVLSFSNSIYQRNKQFEIKIYKLFDSRGYT